MEQPTNPKGKFSVEISETVHRHDLPIITNQEIEQGKSQARGEGAAIVLAVIGVIFLFILMFACMK